MRAIQLKHVKDDSPAVPLGKQDASTQTEPNESAEANDNLNVKMNKCLLMLSHLNTKVDALGANQYQQQGSSSDRFSVKLSKVNFQPVKSLVDFEALEDRCRDEAFVKATVASIGHIHGHHRYTGQGATVSLRIIDHFFSRDFLMKCSWTGASRSSGNEPSKRQKIAFMKYERSIDLFYQTVLYSDPTYTIDECKSFLHRCLKNASQRFAEVSGTRKPVSRKRKRLATGEDREESTEDDPDGDESGDIVIENHKIEEREQDYDDGSPAETSGNTSWQVEFLENNADEEDVPLQLVKSEN
ncbi:uncharacterized protein LOC134287081 [Aedes albopictus]|uniref:DUF4806 domain-containing protein n=1 Tax=Aedes albopictus TaxID=7160 RepID=A0ABM1YWF9_AEDAL